MYEVDEQDRVVELKDVPQSSIGAPLPIVLSDESKVLLAYLLEEISEDWDGTTVRIVSPETEDELIALVEFGCYSSYMFGAPNDEAFEGHPLESRGLHPYGVFEIENSSWIRKLERMNSVHDRHNPKSYEELKHFVFAFHDSTFECIAESFEISIHKGSLESILPEMQKKLFSRFS